MPMMWAANLTATVDHMPACAATLVAAPPICVAGLVHRAAVFLGYRVLFLVAFYRRDRADCWVGVGLSSTGVGLSGR